MQNELFIVNFYVGMTTDFVNGQNMVTAVRPC